MTMKTENRKYLRRVGVMSRSWCHDGDRRGAALAEVGIGGAGVGASPVRRQQRGQVGPGRLFDDDRGLRAGRRVRRIELDARDDAELGQVLEVPLPVRALGGGRRHRGRAPPATCAPRRGTPPAWPQDRLAARADLVGPALVGVHGALPGGRARRARWPCTSNGSPVTRASSSATSCAVKQRIGRHPGRQRPHHLVERGLHAAAHGRAGRLAVERVLHRVEILRRDGDDVVDHAGARPRGSVALVGLEDLVVALAQHAQRQQIQLAQRSSSRRSRAGTKS